MIGGSAVAVANGSVAVGSGIGGDVLVGGTAVSVGNGTVAVGSGIGGVVLVGAGSVAVGTSAATFVGSGSGAGVCPVQAVRSKLVSKRITRGNGRFCLSIIFSLQMLTKFFGQRIVKASSTNIFSNQRDDPASNGRFPAKNRVS